MSSHQVAQKMDNIIEFIEQKREISSYVQLMAGLKYDKERVRRIFERDLDR
jgi:methylphosphotriester-DNA--protein-cysteine methyltransferase